jgi:hypothetical protein
MRDDDLIRTLLVAAVYVRNGSKAASQLMAEMGGKLTLAC